MMDNKGLQKRLKSLKEDDDIGLLLILYTRKS